MTSSDGKQLCPNGWRQIPAFSRRYYRTPLDWPMNGGVGEPWVETWFEPNRNRRWWQFWKPREVLRRAWWHPCEVKSIWNWG